MPAHRCVPQNYLLHSYCLSAAVWNIEGTIQHDEKCFAQPCFVLWTGNTSCKALTGRSFCLKVSTWLWKASDLWDTRLRIDNCNQLASRAAPVVALNACVTRVSKIGTTYLLSSGYPSVDMCSARNCLTAQFEFRKKVNSHHVNCRCADTHRSQTKRR